MVLNVRHCFLLIELICVNVRFIENTIHEEKKDIYIKSEHFQISYSQHCFDN